jgi:hypothetical protein
VESLNGPSRAGPVASSEAPPLWRSGVSGILNFVLRAEF